MRKSERNHMKTMATTEAVSSHPGKPSLGGKIAGGTRLAPWKNR
jgi:hypothetical protein